MDSVMDCLTIPWRHRERIVGLFIGVVACVTVLALSSVLTVEAAWYETGSMTAGRYSHTATLLEDGQVLVVGGFSGAPEYRGFLASAELYDPKTGTWLVTGSMRTGRSSHTATLLKDGRVLVVAGWNGSILSSAEIYDPISGSWSPAGSLGTARYNHTATLLDDSRVLITGGQGLRNDPSSAGYASLGGAEIYDVASGTWSAAPHMSTTRIAHTATTLQDGRVLIAGGWHDTASGDSFSSAEIYSAGAWRRTRPLNVGRGNHTATLLGDGRVLIVGGAGILIDVLNSCELYDPAIDRWSLTGSMSMARWFHQATRLRDNRVLITGGRRGLATPAISGTEVYDATTARWSTAGDMTAPRQYHTATLLLNGTVLVVGGGTGVRTWASAEIYVPD